MLIYILNRQTTTTGSCSNSYGLTTLSEGDVLRVLQDLGLSKRESEVYIFLSQHGMQQVTSISMRLKIERVQTYRILKNLQDKSVIEATLETPTRFAAVPFDRLLDSLIKTRRAEATALENKKIELISYWRNLSAKAFEYPIPKFRVLIDQKRIYAEIIRLVNEAKKEVLGLTTSSDIIQEDLAGILDLMTSLARKNRTLQLKMLTSISKENMKIVEEKLRGVSRGNLNVQWRHLDTGSKGYPQFMMRDGEEVILYVTYGNKSSLPRQPDSGLCINSEMFVSALRQSFLDIWHNATPAVERIGELKTGRPVAETLVIRDAEEARAKLSNVLSAAEKDAVVILSSDMLNGSLKKEFFNHSEKPVRFRIMAPIDLDNLEAANELSETFEIRSVPISYLTMMAVDYRHLFIFNTPPKKISTGNLPSLENLFYTNDQRYVERVGSMLDDIWKRGTDVRELVSGKTARMLSCQVSSSDSVTKLIDCMIKNKASSVIVTERGSPVGIIGERDVLEKVVKPRKDPDKTYAKAIMSMPILSVESNEPLVEAIKIMRKTGMRKVAVFKNGQLSGMFKLD